MRRVARKGSEVSEERTSHRILFHSRSIPVSECECEELCFVLFLARQVAFLLRCFLCMCLVGCCCICILMHFVYVHCGVLLYCALFFAVLRCVVECMLYCRVYVAPLCVCDAACIKMCCVCGVRCCVFCCYVLRCREGVDLPVCVV